MDVRGTVNALADLGVQVYCFALGAADLTSSAGTMAMNVLNAVAQFERDLLTERPQSGLSRARMEGKALGCPLPCRKGRERKSKRILPAALVCRRSQRSSAPAAKRL